MKIFKGGSWRGIVSGKAYVNGAWRTIINGKCYKGGAWRDVCNFASSTGGGTTTPPPDTGGGTITTALSATVIGGSGSGSTVASGNVTLTPTGGSSPYTYLWRIMSDDGNATYAVVNSTLATAYATATNGPVGTIVICTLACTVTDHLGTTATSGTVTCRFNRTTVTTGTGPDTNIP